MSRRRNYKEETIEIIERFFEALDKIVSLGHIAGIQTFCNEYEIDKRNLYAQRKDMNRGYFEIFWILPLIKDFNISKEWLLFGKGEMFA